jgi:hypothetical protein
MTRTWMGLLLGLLLLLAVGVAGCGGDDKPGGVASLGGSGKPTTTIASGSLDNEYRQALAFARCMRQHGINLSDPLSAPMGV